MPSAITPRTRFSFVGWTLLALGALHGVIPLLGGAGYRFFGAGEAMARLAESGSPVPALVTLGIAALLSLFGLYALAGAGRFRPLPLQRPVLVILAGVFTLRGLALGLELWARFHHPAFPLRFLAFSAVSLAMGLMLGSALLRGRDGQRKGPVS